IRCKDVILEDNDVSKALVEFIAQSALEKMVVGYPSRNPFIRRFKTTDIPTSISKGAPDFCTVYVINKGKISSVRQAIRPAPAICSWTEMENQCSLRREVAEAVMQVPSTAPAVEAPYQSTTPHQIEERESIKSPFTRGQRGGGATRSYGDLTFPEAAAPETLSFVSSGRPSVDRSSGSFYDHLDINPAPARLSSASEGLNHSFEMPRPTNPPPPKSMNGGGVWGSGFSASLHEGSNWTSEGSASQTTTSHQADVEAEMRRLKLELMQTMDMYSTACKEALTAKQMARQLHRWKKEEEQRLEEARLSEEAALAIVEKEKEKCRAALEAAEAAQRIAELEAKKRVNAEMKAHREAEEKKKALDALASSDLRYRKYAIQDIQAATDMFAEGRKIGEGGYGPVYKGELDHTPVAIKVLRSDAAQGRSQFQQEVEVLSCIRHPNMVLLLGACPEYGCLVYEYMQNGSLDDRLFRRGGTPALPWQLRFRIAAEIGTGLLFLHQTKPEPLVHRDLKPGNILLDRNFVSKISDVGLARLVPPKVSDDVTQYRMTSTAGTFCYIDPEYQQTGMLGIKSDVYSLGVLLLQLITARPPMGLAHRVERAIEAGTFGELLDPAVTNWPVEEATSFAKMALKCAELRRKDRPDLRTAILPELNRLRALADESMCYGVPGAAPSPADVLSQTSISINVSPSSPSSCCSAAAALLLATLRTKIR
ncbi:hypothetical protein Taro_018129, partial [Colocasia esculenta]|nr:hypothetical protein [Colocasia esculenta]